MEKPVLTDKEILEVPLTNRHHRVLVGKDITTLHRWWRRRLTSNGLCMECGSKPQWLDLANISGEYKNETTDWKYLCRKCHRKFDKRRTNLCRHGHEYTPENTINRNDGTRTCRECQRDAMRRWRNKNGK